MHGVRSSGPGLALPWSPSPRHERVRGALPHRPLSRATTHASCTHRTDASCAGTAIALLSRLELAVPDACRVHASARARALPRCVQSACVPEPRRVRRDQRRDAEGGGGSTGGYPSHIATYILSPSAAGSRGVSGVTSTSLRLLARARVKVRILTPLHPAEVRKEVASREDGVRGQGVFVTPQLSRLCPHDPAPP